ncbi:MAG TPA: M20/M25/M40 family metallo-hydrolase [Methylomirabilota bacterium]|nr:M20/M25/M40 family metallo-hydrolase [Methylomirabilota bacterium]
MPAPDVATESTELLRTLIRNACVNDGDVASGQEARNADAIDDFLAGSGLRCERYEAAPGRVSLVARIEGRDPVAPSLLLMGHTDVVPVNPAGWHRDPFGGEVVDGIVWGRGAIDMLNITATMAVALRRLAWSGFRPRGSLVYLAVADEEAGGRYGADHLVTHALEAVRADYVVTESGGVPIPTASGPRLPLTVGEKGANWWRLTVRGTPGHGSMPFRTDNALVTAAEVVRRLAAYQPKARILPVWRQYVEGLDLPPDLTAALTDPGRVREAALAMDELGLARMVHACTHTTFSPNVVRGGSKVNVVPDRVEIEVDIRALPGVAPAEVDAMLAEALGELAARVEVDAPHHGEGSLSPFAGPLVDALARVTRALVPGSRIIPRLTTGGTDARFFRQRGIPAYGFALHSPRIPHAEYPLMFHGHDERVDVESLRLSSLMWEALCRDFLG